MKNKINFFLVIDPQLLSEAGDDMLVAKIPSPNKVKQLKFAAGMFHDLQAGSLLIDVCRLIDSLRDVMIHAVQDGVSNDRPRGQQAPQTDDNPGPLNALTQKW